jgi:cystathionine beta-synthase
VGDAESFYTARAVARREGLLVGGSSGTAVAAALRYARRLTQSPDSRGEGGHLVVALCPDTGRNYLSKMFDEKWLAQNGLLYAERPAHSLGDLLKTRKPRPLISISPEAPVATAIELLQKNGVSQLPVLKAGQAVGSIQEVTLARLLHDRIDVSKVPVQEIMAKPLPQLDVTTHLDEAYRLLLAGNTGVLAVADGKVLDIITRIDLIQYWDPQRTAKA